MTNALLFHIGVLEGKERGEKNKINGVFLLGNFAKGGERWLKFAFIVDNRHLGRIM